MADTIEKVYIQTYENTVRHLAQQGIARLRPWVMEKSVQSEAHNWERLGRCRSHQQKHAWQHRSRSTNAC